MTILLPKSKDGFRPTELMAIKAYGDARAAEARREALEDAAKVCADIAKIHLAAFNAKGFDKYLDGASDGACECADALDALLNTKRKWTPLYAIPPTHAVVPIELLTVMQEVLRISDRKHDAWDKAKELIEVAQREWA